MVDPISASLLAAGLSGAFEVGGLTVAYSSIAAYALVGGAVVGGAILVNALTPKQHTDSQITVKQATPPRTRCYGRALIGGSYFFFAATSVLVSGFVLCEGPIDSFEQHWFNGIISSDGGVLDGHADTYPWNRYVCFDSQLGGIDQSVQGVITQQFGFWDGTHRLRGLATTVMRCYLPGNPAKNFSKFYPSGVPSYLARIRGALVYDPRDTGQSWADCSTWKWSANPALCILDFMTVTVKDATGREIARGMGVPRSRINLASFAAMANLCDQPVALGALGVTDDDLAAGTAAEARYTLWGTYSLDEEPKDVLDRMLKTCDGELYPLQDGTIGLRGGEWTVPTVKISPDIILSVDATRGVDKLAKFNQLRIRTISLSNQFQVVEGDPWDDIASQEASGEVLPQDFELVMVPSYTQGQRLAKIAMAKGNPAWILTIVTNLAGLNALGERTIHVTYPDFGIDEDMFVSGFEITSETSCKIRCGSLSAAAYQWSTDEEANAAPGQIYTPPAAFVPQAPVGLVLQLTRTDIGNGTTAAVIDASVTPPDDTSLELVAQYQQTGSTAWLDMSVDNNAYTATTAYLNDGSTYTVRVALSTYGGSIGAYVTASIQVVADATAPQPPSNFVANASAGSGGSQVALSWTDSSSANSAGIMLYRGRTNSFTAATSLGVFYASPNASSSTADSPGPGTWRYWIAAVNGSGVASAPVGPISVSV